MTGADTGSRNLLREIQALRAVAVALVVLFHVWPAILPGGYIGVDVFFVISGFLITAHLLREYGKNGRISLRSFWVRRIRRLLPAALVVLAACVVLAFTILPSVVRLDTLRQVGGAAAYVLNWVLAYDAVDYLASDNSATVVQHFWTLGVEEQFYVVWPVLLVLVLALALKLRRTTTSATVVLWSASVVGVLSFAYSIYLTWFSPSIAFFATTTRAWEFAVGAVFAALVAGWPSIVDAAREHPLVRRAALPTLLGFALIIGSAFLMSAETPFPSGWAAFPVVGALLVIAGGLPQTLALPRILGWRPVQFVGDVSYSLYLWHWPPIVVFLLLVGRPPGVLEGLGIIALSVVLAALTRRFVEEPARKARLFSRRQLPAFALALVGAIAFVGIYGATRVVTERVDAEQAAIWHERLTDTAGCYGANATLGAADCADPFVLSPETDLAAAATDLNTTDWCLTWYYEEWVSCELGDKAGPNGTVAFVGDSHAASLVPALSEFFAGQGIRMVTYLRFACSGLSEYAEGFGDTGTGQQEQDCRTWSERVRDELSARDDIDTVLYTNFSSDYVSQAREESTRLTADEVVDTWSLMLESGKKVVWLTDPPVTGGRDIPSCLAGHQGQDSPCSLPRDEALPSNPLPDAVTELEGRVQVIDMTDAYCDDTTCHSVIGDVVVYPDSNHLAGRWATSLMQYLGPKLLEARAAAPAGS